MLVHGCRRFANGGSWGSYGVGGDVRGYATCLVHIMLHGFVQLLEPSPAQPTSLLCGVTPGSLRRDASLDTASASTPYGRHTTLFVGRRRQGNY